MAVGMRLHKQASPRPPSPSFKIKIPSRLSRNGGTFRLVFYVPDDYFTLDSDYLFPVVLNFHGGGFTLGTGTDDARWASSVITNAEAVFVSVEYRLAPEHPFSVGLEDCTDALIYLASHAPTLRINPHKIALSGFSAGGNYVLTVPLMLWDLQNETGKRTISQDRIGKKKNIKPKLQTIPSASSSTSQVSKVGLELEESEDGPVKITPLEPTLLEVNQELPDLTICALVSFYPPTDFRSTREAKRATNPRKDLNLPPMLTKLFDKSYLEQCADIDMDDPYLSPAAASDDLLRAAYPDTIIIYTCEYDMLQAEGNAFGERLRGEGIGKNVKGGLVKEVPHAFDKKPNPLSFPKSADRCYGEACAELRRVFGKRDVSVEERTQLEKSKPVERFDSPDGSVNEGSEEELSELVQGMSFPGSNAEGWTELSDAGRDFAPGKGKMKENLNGFQQHSITITAEDTSSGSGPHVLPLPS